MRFEYRLSPDRRRALRGLTAAAVTGAALLSGAAPALPGASAAWAKENSFTTQTSRLIGGTLPGTPETTNDKSFVNKMMIGVNQIGDRTNLQVAEGEILGWDVKHAANADPSGVRDRMIAHIKAKGYSYEVMSGTFTMQGLDKPLRLFTAKKADSTLAGYWIEHKEGVMLCWAKMKGQRSLDEAVSRGSVPAQIVGNWRRTMISGSSVYSSSGAYQGAGGVNGAQIYHFRKDGTYKLYNYISSYSYGRRVETYTWENGKFSVDGNRLALRPTGGKYKVTDSGVGGNNYERPMRADEIKKNAKRWYWRAGSGSSVFLGSDPAALSEYKRVKE